MAGPIIPTPHPHLRGETIPVKSLPEQITDFETRYIPLLKQWTLSILPQDLERVATTLEDIRKSSEAITAQFTPDQATLYRQRWQPLLKQALTLTEPIMTQLRRVLQESQVSKTLLQRGQMGLRGYRRNLPRHEGNFDSEA